MRVSLYNAAKIPLNKPNKRANKIDVKARTKVFLNVFSKITETGVPIWAKDSLK